MREIEAGVGQISLVDHHVHGALREDVGRETLESSLTESDRPIPGWMTQFDSPLGFAVRRWCAPVLGLERHASAENYVARRAELGAREVNRRLLSAAGVGHYLLDTGYRGDAILDLAGMTEAASAPVGEIVRLETVAEDLAVSGVTARDFVRRYPEVLAERTATSAGLKSIVAYRHGFGFDPCRPDGPETEAAAGEWLRAVETTGTARVEDPVLLRFLLWSGLDRGLPLQLHTGYGDPDLALDRCDPLLLTPWLKLAEPSKVDVMLLHCYPYHRQAGYLAQVFPHVYFDVGLAVNHTGVSSAAVLAESLELAPFAKILFSTDAWGPAELHYLGALLWRRGMSRVLGTWAADGDVSPADALRVARMIGAGNARRVYRLPG
ncbi:amidohydrolase family protein [Amycolatopsis pigmentata]|uniref:Amidohydrolase family protein n=1 Tax=Amycolatopsis pigmentata TaxID=450801 RepID=A0ABW5G1H7_9PSEU